LLFCLLALLWNGGHELRKFSGSKLFWLEKIADWECRALHYYWKRYRFRTPRGDCLPPSQIKMSKFAPLIRGASAILYSCTPTRNRISKGNVYLGSLPKMEVGLKRKCLSIFAKMQNFISILISPKNFQTFYFRKSFRENHLTVFCFWQKLFKFLQWAIFFKPTREFATLSTSVFARICKIHMPSKYFHKIWLLFSQESAKSHVIKIFSQKWFHHLACCWQI